MLESQLSCQVAFSSLVQVSTSGEVYCRPPRRRLGVEAVSFCYCDGQSALATNIPFAIISKGALLSASKPEHGAEDPQVLKSAMLTLLPVAG